jgi:formamidopyrimidine-DNA glycosylase
VPELPEVEVTRLSFAHRIEGAKVLSVRVGKPLRWPLGCEPKNLIGQRIGQVSRRGKYLWLSMSDGGLLLHLGMSGSLAFGQTTSQAKMHDHFDLDTTHGMLRLTDPRRFGAVVWSTSLGVDPAARLLCKLGLEPFDLKFTAQYLYESLQRKRTTIKQALLAGDIVVGAGNIYACEALFLANIHPYTPSCEIHRQTAGRLARVVRTVLKRAIQAGGTTLRDFQNTHGAAGAFQLQTKVYGREGLPCRVCSHPIERIIQAQRSTFFCSRCQIKP